MRNTNNHHHGKVSHAFIRAGIVFILFFIPLLLFAVIIRVYTIYFHLLLLFSGWFAWTFTEYCHHRFHSHATVIKREAGIMALHHYHHHHPGQIRITGLQRMILTVLSLAFVGLSIWLDNYFTLFAGYFLGFTGYTFMHWFLHSKASAQVFPVLHQFHIHHHCKHPDKCFGVSVPWWDYLFKTIPAQDDVISSRILTFYYKKEELIS